MEWLPKRASDIPELLPVTNREPAARTLTVIPEDMAYIENGFLADILISSKSTY